MEEVHEVILSSELVENNANHESRSSSLTALPDFRPGIHPYCIMSACLHTSAQSSYTRSACASTHYGPYCEFITFYHTRLLQIEEVVESRLANYVVKCAHPSTPD